MFSFLFVFSAKAKPRALEKARALLEQGQDKIDRNQPRPAIGLLKEAIQLFKEGEDPNGVASAETALAEAERMLGPEELFEERMEQGTAYFDEGSHLLYEKMDLDAAEQSFQNAQEIFNLAGQLGGAIVGKE